MDSRTCPGRTVQAETTPPTHTARIGELQSQTPSAAQRMSLSDRCEAMMCQSQSMRCTLSVVRQVVPYVASARWTHIITCAYARKMDRVGGVQRVVCACVRGLGDSGGSCDCFVRVRVFLYRYQPLSQALLFLLFSSFFAARGTWKRRRHHPKRLVKIDRLCRVHADMGRHVRPSFQLDTAAP